MKSTDLYTMELREEQWDLIVLALSTIRSMTVGDSTYTIDQLGRKFLRRRCEEIIGTVQAIVPASGK